MNKKFFLFILAAIGIIFAFFLFVPKYRQQPRPVSVNESAATPSIYTIEASEESTPFDLLKALTEKEGIELVTQQYDFGIFVKSIGDKESSTDKAWIYFVNGQSGQVAADQMRVNPGDTVEWKYIPPMEE